LEQKLRFLHVSRFFNCVLFPSCLQKPALENCAVPGYYAASSGNLFPTTYRPHLRLITQQNAFRIYLAAEASTNYHSKYQNNGLNLYDIEYVSFNRSSDDTDSLGKKTASSTGF
jgi:hypothetical protein